MRRTTFFISLTLTILAAPASAETTDAEIRELLIAQSIVAYRGNCACPYNVDRAGRRCGVRSAYSKPGGARPMCYLSDVTDEMVHRYKLR